MLLEYEFGDYEVEYKDVEKFLRKHLKGLEKEAIIDVLYNIEDENEFHELTPGEVLREVLNLNQDEPFYRVYMTLRKYTKEELIDLLFDIDLQDELQEHFREEILLHFIEEAFSELF